MRLAAITDEISQDFEHALDVLREYDARGAELRGLWNTNIADLSQEQAEQAKKALETRGMEVVCLSTPFYKCDLDMEAVNQGEAVGRMHLATPRGLEQQMDILNRCIELAHFFGTDKIRVFTFWRKEALTPALEDRIAELFTEPLNVAAQAGITLVLENEHACYIGTGAEAARLAGKINSPNLKICWDPGNAFAAGEHPFPDGYNEIQPWLGHVHVKDARMIDTPQQGLQAKFCRIGTGEIDYAGHFAALQRDGYTGWVSLETHYAPEGGTPEDGSRECLAALRTWITG